MLKLQTFGGVAVLDESGMGGEAAVESASATRRTLAILAALAVAGEVGLSRDKLIGLFWAESDVERARHALTQALYAAKRGLGHDELIIGSADLRLNSAVISSDVAEFEAAIAGGDLASAAAAYRGPFLDGFFLSAAPEFERWASAQRARFEASAARALEQLAQDADDAGDSRAAGEWWRRLAIMRPLDSRIALRLMRSMAAAGDRAGALQHAHVHEMMLEQELGLSPDQAIIEFSAQLRDNSAAAVIGATPNDSLATATPSKSSASSDSSASSAVQTPGVTGAGTAGRKGPWWKTPVLMVSAAALVALGAQLGRRGDDEHVHSALPSQRVVVAPFRVTAATSELEYLREGIIELLFSRLVEDSATQAPDAGAVLAAWRSAGLLDEGDAPRDEVVELAGRLGAERVVTGSVVGSPDRVIIAATILRAPSGTVMGQATVEGRADSLAKMLDQLAARLLLAQAGEDVDVVGRIPESLAALRAYLVGQAAAQRRGYHAAFVSYERALRFDSTFARAALRLAWAADRINETEAQHRGIALAFTARDNLTERDQALLRTFTGPRYPALSTAGEQLLAWRRAVDVAPRTALAWLALGARLFHDGDVVGLETSAERARSALERASALDAGNVASAEVMLQLRYREGATTTDSAVRAAALGDSLSPVSAYLRWRVVAARGDSADLRRMREQFGQLRVSTLRMIVMASQYDSIALEEGEHAARVLFDRASDEAGRADALTALHGLLVNQGRWRDALEVTNGLRQLQPGLHGYLRLRVLDAMYGGGDAAAGRAAAEELERLTSAGLAGSPLTAASWASNRCVLAQWRLNGGDTSGVRQIVIEMRAQSLNSRRPGVTAAPQACAELLEASLAVVTRSPDAAQRVARIDSLAFTPQTAGDAVTYAPLLISKLHERLGDGEGALRAVRKRTYMTVWPRYLNAMRRNEARLSQREGA